jgi:hypothetical protein
MSKSEQFLEPEGRYGVSGEVCFHFPLDADDFFIDVISWIALRQSLQTIHEITRINTNKEQSHLTPEVRGVFRRDCNF